jgi:hypothetical protein
MVVTTMTMVVVVVVVVISSSTLYQQFALRALDIPFLSNVSFSI